jgi:hypothetical protein
VSVVASAAAASMGCTSVFVRSFSRAQRGVFKKKIAVITILSLQMILVL